MQTPTTEDTRTILVHLNVQIRDDQTRRTADEIAEAIELALRSARIVHGLAVEVTLAEEI